MAEPGASKTANLEGTRIMVDTKTVVETIPYGGLEIIRIPSMIGAVSVMQLRRKLAHLPPSAFATLLEFVTRRTGPRKKRAPGPFPRPAPLKGLGRGVFFSVPCPCPRSGHRPTHTPGGSPLKIGGNKRGPVQRMSAGGPRTGAGWGLPETYPPGPM